MGRSRHCHRCSSANHGDPCQPQSPPALRAYRHVQRSRRSPDESRGPRPAAPRAQSSYRPRGEVAPALRATRGYRHRPCHTPRRASRMIAVARRKAQRHRASEQSPPSTTDRSTVPGRRTATEADSGSARSPDRAGGSPEHLRNSHSRTRASTRLRSRCSPPKQSTGSCRFSPCAGSALF